MNRISPREAINIQLKLEKRINLKASFQRVSQIRTLASFDVAYDLDKKEVYGGGLLFSFPELKVIERNSAKRKLTFPYIPGLLTFREGPVLLATYKKFKKKPDLLLFDGQGITHPRRMGEATHLGIILNKASIGCAKSSLFGLYKIPKRAKGNISFIFGKKGEKIGAVVRTKEGVRPVFISQGYKIGLDLAIEVILACSRGFRLPEPMRLAHQFAESQKNLRNKRDR